MKETIALLPGVIAAWCAWRRGHQSAFVDVYLAALVLLPDYYYWNAPGLPDPSFVEAAIVPAAIAFLLRRDGAWRWSLTDVLVGAYAVFVAASEYRAAGFKEAQNLMFDCLTGVLLPYVLAKGIIEPRGLRATVAKRLVLLFFAVSCLSVFEFRFGQNPYRMLFDPFFAGQGRGWVVSIRWGFGRIAGPYGHAILAGVMLIAAYRLARWTDANELWPEKLRRWQPLRTGAILSLGILAGLLMTLCRGPWLGAILAAGLSRFGRAKDKRTAMLVALGFCVCVLLPAALAFKAYVSVGRSGAQSATQETAAYRFELLQNYLDIVAQKPALGWGRSTWPKVPGQPSIDNHYLLLLLMHGVSATLTLLALVGWIGGRLFLHGMREPGSSRSGQSFTFTLLGTILGIAFAVTTVFMGLNTQPLLFLLFGWGEGYLLAGCRPLGTATATPRVPSGPYRFQRVVT